MQVNRDDLCDEDGTLAEPLSEERSGERKSWAEEVEEELGDRPHQPDRQEQGTLRWKYKREGRENAKSKHKIDQ